MEGKESDKGTAQSSDLDLKIQECVRTLVRSRRNKTVVMRIEVVNQLYNMTELLRERMEFHSYLRSKYMTPQKNYYSDDELSLEEKQKVDELYTKLATIVTQRRSVTRKIDRQMALRGFEKTHVSMFVMYIRDENATED